MDLSSKLANNSKLTSNEYKKHLKNNLCFYCGVGDHKLDFCSKKQTTVTLKDYNALVATNLLYSCFWETLKKIESNS